MRVTGHANKAGLTYHWAIKDKTNPRSPILMKWKKRTARRYREFLSNRFARFSRGQGYWKKTKKWKRGKTRFLLRDTNTIYRSLSTTYRGLPGQYEKITATSVVTGIGGSGKHPKFRGTVARLAAIHNFGEGFMPKRQIIVRPDSKLRKTILQDLENVLNRPI